MSDEIYWFNISISTGTPKGNRRDSFWSHRPSISFGFGGADTYVNDDTDFENEEPTEKVVT